ncbi:MAG: hypothetical protein ACRDZP_02415 [Acidimicrobiales bacterium]
MPRILTTYRFRVPAVLVIAASFALLVGVAPARAGYGGGYGGTSGSGIWALTWWAGSPEGPGPYTGPQASAAGLCIWHDVGGEVSGLDAGLSQSSLPESFWTKFDSGGHPGIWGINIWASRLASHGKGSDHFDLVACPDVGEVPQSGPDIETSLPRARPPRAKPLWVWIFWDTVPDPKSGSLPPLIARAFSETELPSPAPAISPSSVGGAVDATVVNVATWLWINGSIWHTYKASASSGGLVATVWAAPVSLKWTAGWSFPSPRDDPQRGVTLAPESLDQTCDGPGTPYDSAVAEQFQSTSCSAAFRQSTLGTWQTLRATVSWQVHWALTNDAGVVGGEGVLPDVTTSGTMPLRVMQVESIISAG